MTIEEAIKLLEIQKPVLGCKEYKKPLMCAYEMAIKAMEKQIPKKPLQYEHDYICLCCGYVLAESVDDNCDLEEEMAGWCPYCGQKIDWKVEE